MTTLRCSRRLRPSPSNPWINRTGYLLRRTNRQDIRHWNKGYGEHWPKHWTFSLLAPKVEHETDRVLNHTKRKARVWIRQHINAGSLKIMCESFLKETGVTHLGNYIAPQDHQTLEPPK